MGNETTYFRPVTAKEAVELAATLPGHSAFIAGGTDLMVNRFQGNASPAALIDLAGITGLGQIEIVDGNMEIGALVNLNTLTTSPLVKKHFPGISEAAQSVGSYIIRESATLGGNILCENRCNYFNQSENWRTTIGLCLKCDGDTCIATGGTKACFSKMSSDTAPMLISLNAKIRIEDSEGRKTLPLESIYTGDGIKPVNLPPRSLITHILIPLQPGIISAFMKLRPRETMDFSSLTVCMSKTTDGEIKIVLGSIDPGPVIVTGNETSDIEDLIKKAWKGARSVDNDYYSRKYRKEMIRVFCRKLWSGINGQ